MIWPSGKTFFKYEGCQSSAGTGIRGLSRPCPDIIFSNAIGSNVFDINLGLGFPMLIFTLGRGEPVSLLKADQWVRAFSYLITNQNNGFILVCD